MYKRKHRKGGINQNVEAEMAFTMAGGQPLHWEFSIFFMLFYAFLYFSMLFYASMLLYPLI